MKHLDYIGQPNWEGKIEYVKSKVRSKVEHIFYIEKRIFGYRKVVYRGIAKNTGRLYMLFASACSVEIVVGNDACKSVGGGAGG
jgi:hypothetical protein